MREHRGSGTVGRSSVMGGRGSFREGTMSVTKLWGSVRDVRGSGGDKHISEKDGRDSVLRGSVSLRHGSICVSEERVSGRDGRGSGLQ